MIIDRTCLGKWMWRKTLFYRQIFKPLHIISGPNIMGEKVIGLSGGRFVGFSYYHFIVTFRTSLDDWHFLEREDYCRRR